MKIWRVNKTLHIDCTKKQAVQCTAEDYSPSISWTATRIKKINKDLFEMRCLHAGPDFRKFLDKVSRKK